MRTLFNLLFITSIFTILTCHAGLETGKQITASFQANQVINIADELRQKPAIFAIDLKIPENPRGVIYECGASICGSWVGFNKEGTFYVHCGAGTLNHKHAATIVINKATAPSGAGTLIWAFDPVAKTASAWWNGQPIGTATSKGAFPFNAWAGGDPGCVGFKKSHIINGADQSDFNGSLMSDLRFYSNQSI